mmetsp:Transcript_41838/g.87833  ORF Transcript_41838/g.87833 Transcript_41838/m.87833 type:complete len:226 (+) Transcript_41838:1536-2213(+)
MVALGWDLVVFGDADQFPIPTPPVHVGIERFDPFHPVPIPPARPPLPAHDDLVILGGIETHVPRVVAKQRIAHETRVIRVRPPIQPPRVRQVQIMPELVHLHGRHGVEFALVHAQPRVDEGVGRPSALCVTPLQHVHDVRERRIGYGESELFPHLEVNGAPYDLHGIMKGDGNGHLQHSRSAQFLNDVVVVLSVSIGNDVQSVPAAGCELRFHRFDVAVRAENLV